MFTIFTNPLSFVNMAAISPGKLIPFLMLPYRLPLVDVMMFLKRANVAPSYNHNVTILLTCFVIGPVNICRVAFAAGTLDNVLKQWENFILLLRCNILYTSDSIAR